MVNQYNRSQQPEPGQRAVFPDLHPGRNHSAEKTVTIFGLLQYNSAMTRDFNVVIERDTDGYFVASVPTLLGCHTQARSLDELMSRIQEAIELCLDVEGEPFEELEFIGVQRVRLAI